MTKAVVVGAAGYTGRLTAHELSRLGVPALLVGRNPETIGAVGRATGLDHVVVADATEVGEHISAGDVVVSLAGPFVDHGYGPLRAALNAKAHYLDCAGEHAFIRDVFATYDSVARDAGVAVVPAMAADWIPGNLAGTLALLDAGDEAHSIEIRYITTGPYMIFSNGSSATGLRLAEGAPPPFAWRDGRLGATDHESITFDFRGEQRVGHGVAGTEHFALPALAPSLQDVFMYISFPPARRSAAEPGTSDGATKAERAMSRQQIEARVFNSDRTEIASCVLTGPNGYDYSASMLAWGAQQALASPLTHAGVLGPVQAFGVDALSDGSEAAGMVGRRPGR